MKRTWFLFLLMLFVTSATMADVWEVRHDWNLDWENKYSKWIADEVTEDLMKPANIAVDCADLCYFVRAIFSRNNGLPFLASDAYGNQISHELDRWNHQSKNSIWYEDRRFRSFLFRLRDHVSTKSFPHNTYPVKLCRDTVQPGLVIYENLIASHACFVGRVKPANLIPVIYFEASVPPRVPFKKSTILGVYIYPPEVSNKHSGIVRWNWPKNNDGHWSLVPDEEMPFYSLEIYGKDFPYRQELSKPLNQIAKSTPHKEQLNQEEYIEELVSIFKEEIEFRANVVREAQSILKEKPNDFRSESFDYKYNTESRDDRLFQLMRQIWHAINQYEIPRQNFFHSLQQIFISISPSLPDVNLYYLFITVDQRWIHSDAYVSPEKRWGIFWDEDKKQWIFDKKHTIEDLKPRYDINVNRNVMKRVPENLDDYDS